MHQGASSTRQSKLTHPTHDCHAPPLPQPGSAGCSFPPAVAAVKCAIDAEFIDVVNKLRAAFPRPYLLSSAVWSIGAYGQARAGRVASAGGWAAQADGAPLGGRLAPWTPITPYHGQHRSQPASTHPYRLALCREPGSTLSPRATTPGSRSTC